MRIGQLVYGCPIDIRFSLAIDGASLLCKDLNLCIDSLSTDDNHTHKTFILHPKSRTMKRIVVFFTAVLVCFTTFAQEKTLKEVLTLKMPKTVDDDMPGTRGASVVWHPVQKKYYAAFAGNWEYPLAVFDAKGTILSQDTLTTQEDLRGLWYNADSKNVEGNAFDENGWFTYKLNAKGIPVLTTTLIEGMNQPDKQSVGTFNYKTKDVLFVYDSKVHFYNHKDGTPISTVDINWGQSDESSEPNDPENYNYTSIIYTGIPKAEVGFLNITDRRIELYDLSTGFLTRTLALPEEAPAEASFNFAYANGIYWLFDMEGRTWHGYK
jgi:hypothetical protein